MGFFRIFVVFIYFEIMFYCVNFDIGIIDYDQFEKNVQFFCFKIFVVGILVYCCFIDYECMCKIVDLVGVYFVVDIVYIFGFVVFGVIFIFFEYVDVVIIIIYKFFCGFCGVMIFFCKGVCFVDVKIGKEIFYDFEDKINFFVFFGYQGGFYNYIIIVFVVVFKQVVFFEFKVYQEKVVVNVKIFERVFKEQGYKFVFDGIDFYMVFFDFCFFVFDGVCVEVFFEQINIICNKNVVFGDKSVFIFGGFCIGIFVMIFCGFGEVDFECVVKYIDESIKFCKEVQVVFFKEVNKFKDFKVRVVFGEVFCINEFKKEIVEWFFIFFFFVEGWRVDVGF